MKLFKNADFVSNGEYLDINSRSIGVMPLLKEVLAHDTEYVAECGNEFYVNKDPQFPNLIDKYTSWFLERGGRRIWKQISIGNESHMFLWKDGLAEVSIIGTYLKYRVFSKNEALVQEAHKTFSSQKTVEEKKGAIYAITQDSEGLTLQNIGSAGVPCIPGNYTPKVMEDYQYAVNDLKSSQPSGRIMIMTGIPGSGKTFLIRSLLLELPQAMFVLVPPDMIASMAGPQLLPLLLSYKSGKGPIILVLEDADKCLVSRDEGDMSAIQSLLNLGDGIVGSLLDLRIVATTNATELDMEEALMRPCRLSKMIKVGALDMTTARGVFTRLLPNEPVPFHLKDEENDNFKMSLAEVYALARRHGWKPEEKQDLSSDDVDQDLDS